MERQKFGTKIIQHGKTYLMAEDCAHALGYASVEGLVEEHGDLIKKSPMLPMLLLEEDYNRLLIQNKNAFSRQWHVEITKLDSLRIHTENEMAIYPLKLMFAKELFEYKARETGCGDVKEYICKYDFLEAERKNLKELIESRNMADFYLKECDNLARYVSKYEKNLKENNLKVQMYTEISDRRISLNVFVVGLNVMHEIYLDDEDICGYSVNEKGDLCIKEYDYDSGEYICSNKGQTVKKRDFRCYNTLDNIIWILRTQKINDAGYDLLECSDPGTYIHLSSAVAFKLLNPNMSRDMTLFNSIVHLEEEVRITDFEEGTVFA